jgi:hypothetical protein
LLFNQHEAQTSAAGIIGIRTPEFIDLISNTAAATECNGRPALVKIPANLRLRRYGDIV